MCEFGNHVDFNFTTLLGWSFAGQKIRPFDSDASGTKPVIKNVTHVPKHPKPLQPHKSDASLQGPLNVFRCSKRLIAATDFKHSRLSVAVGQRPACLSAAQTPGMSTLETIIKYKPVAFRTRCMSTACSYQATVSCMRAKMDWFELSRTKGPVARQALSHLSVLSSIGVAPARQLHGK